MDTKGIIREAIVEALMLEIDPESLDDSEDLNAALGIDSVGFLEILVALENRFGLEFDEGTINRKNSNTIKKLSQMVDSILAQDKAAES